MAVAKYPYLDTNGILKLSTDIFTNVNTRIGERILAAPVVDSYYTEDKKTLSAKAVLALIGKTSDTASAEGSIYARIAQNAADIATNASDISDLNTSVGASTDAADATGSVYARIAATKAVADQAATDIGASTDSADAAGSLYARIAKNAADISTNAGNISQNATDIGTINTSIGESTDAAAADGSLYARIKKNATDISTLNTSVGASGDAASASGSVYARIAQNAADIATNAGNISQNATDIGTINTSLGTTSDAASATGSVYARIAATKAVADKAATDIGASTDSADASGSLFARIAAVNAEISSLTHLTYQVVTGDIEVQVPPAQAKADVLYLQHDEPSLAVNNAGYLIDSNGAPATTGGYYGWVDPATGVIYRANDTTSHTSTVLAADDPLLVEGGPVARVEDTTYNLYVATNITASSVDWLCVGDTEIALSNYWSKTDADVAALQALILEAIPDATITAQVTAAFNATTPSLT